MKCLSFSVSLLCLLGACTTNNNTADPSGTYTRHQVDEVGQLWDTLVIRQQGESGQQFLIENKHRIWNKKLDDTGMADPVYKNLRLNGTYSNTDHTLTVQETQVTYVYQPTTGKLVHGSVEYVKMK